MDRKFVITSFGYAILGLGLGIYRAFAKNHGHLVTHAYFMLVGFVMTFIYDLCHKLWLNNDTSLLAKTQYYIHQFGMVVMLVGLFLLYGQYVAENRIDPVLGAASLAVLAGVILMAIMVVKSDRNN